MASHVVAHVLMLGVVRGVCVCHLLSCAWTLGLLSAFMCMDSVVVICFHVHGLCAWALCMGLVFVNCFDVCAGLVASLLATATLKVHCKVRLIPFLDKDRQVSSSA